MEEREDTSFRRLFDAAARPMWVCELGALRFVYVNDATCRLYGWSREELLTMTLRDIRPPEELARLERVAPHKADRPRSTVRAARHWTKDKRLLEVDLETVRVSFRGEPATFAIATDVTGVAEADRRFRLLVEHSADGSAMLDELDVVQYLSPRAERMLGLERGALTGARLADAVHPNDTAKIVDAPPGETRRYVVRMHHRGDDSWPSIEITTSNLTADSAVRAHVVSFRDVTQQVHAEQALRQSEANFRSLIEHTPTLVFVHRAGRIVYINPALVAALGYDAAADLVGRDVVELVHPDDRAPVRARMQRTVRDGGGAPGLARMRRRDGTYLMAEGEGLLLAFDGEPSNVVLGRDVSERNAMLARMAVADRLASMGTLAAGVAHEINNPLSYVTLNLSILTDELCTNRDKEPRLSAEQLEGVLRDAREGTARVSAIVRQLHALARSDDETTALVDVCAALASSLKMVANEARHRARLVTSIEPDLPPVKGNASRLGQVFLNLLVNAAQAIGDADPKDHEIRVSARSLPPHVVVEVSDTGPGIPPGVLPRIFDPFFTTKPIGVGTGLGLSISHEIVRSLGGMISVDSAPGRGTTFRVVLPASSSPGESVSTPSESVAVTSARVLMIDDEAVIGSAARMLMKGTYEITPVTRAKDALALVSRGELFDAIVCDLMMPETSGMEFYEQLVVIAPEYARRVVFMTGGAFTERAREFLEHTRQPELPKPFTAETLRDAVESVRGGGAPDPHGRKTSG